MVKAKMINLDHMLKGDIVYMKWNNIISEAMSNLIYPSFTWACLPESGGYYDQDQWIMMIWEITRNAARNTYNSDEYQEHIKIKNSKK